MYLIIDFLINPFADRAILLSLGNQKITLTFDQINTDLTNQSLLINGEGKLDNIIKETKSKFNK